jgi:hypothetical protein
MNKHGFGSNVSSQERTLPREEDDKIQYLLGAEEQLLRLISIRAPLPKMLEEVCRALDCQIGNVVSLIALPGDDPAELIEIAGNLLLFGLYTFCSEGVVAGNGELLGSLEVYSCDSRTPTAREVQWIERAKCLAAIAIQRHKDAAPHRNCGMRESFPARGRVLEWPDAPNES